MAASEAWDANLQSEDIISEVKKRPILYNKSLPEYSNKLLKNKIWEDIARSMSSDWGELTDLVRTIRCRDVQTRWKHVRDNFRRDLQVNKDIYRKGKKKKKYRYFNQMSFLIPFITDTPVKDTRKDDEGSADPSPPPQTAYISPSDLPQHNSAPIPKRRHTRSPERNLEYEVIEALSKRNVEAEDDDDKAFCQSLVKSMKKIDDANKLTARMEILNVIRKFSYPEQHLLHSQEVHGCPCAAWQAKRMKMSDRPVDISRIQSGHSRASASSTVTRETQNLSEEQREIQNLTEEVILPVEIKEVKLEVSDDS